MQINKLLRSNIQQLIALPATPTTQANVVLDKNENAFGSPLMKWYNRYPANAKQQLKEGISKIKGIAPEHIFTANGRYECYDMLLRCFCEPTKDNVIVCSPAGEQLQKLALLNNVEIRQSSLLDDFQLDLIHLENLADVHTKIIFIASPNTVSGVSLKREDVELLLNNFNGLVIIDEAYINFSRQKSFIPELREYTNLVIVQTFSKAWGLAGLRVANMYACAELIEVFDKVQQQYPISIATQELLLKALEDTGQVNDMIKEMVAMRQALINVLQQVPIVEQVYKSDANFLLVKVNDANALHEFLLAKGIAVKNVSDKDLCENCLRISIGTEQEITKFIDGLAGYCG